MVSAVFQPVLPCADCDKESGSTVVRGFFSSKDAKAFLKYSELI